MSAEKKVFHLVHEQAKRNAAAACMSNEYDGFKVTLAPPAKTRDQEEHYHSQIGDIAKQHLIHGRQWDAECMKRLLIDQFWRDTKDDPDLRQAWADMGDARLVPSMDGSGVVALGWQSRRFPKKLASAFIEWLFAMGAEVGIQWSNEPQRETEPA